MTVAAKRRRDLKGILMFFEHEKPKFRGRGAKARRRLSEVTKSRLSRIHKRPGIAWAFAILLYMETITSLLYAFLHFLLGLLELFIGFFISVLTHVLNFARSIVGMV